MALFEFPDLVGTFEDLLERERQALLAGRFDLLERLMIEKERLTEKLVRQDKEPASLDRLRASVRRNGRLLEAATLGLNDARIRLDALKAQPAALQTYDATGRKISLTVSPPPWKVGD